MRNLLLLCIILAFVFAYGVIPARAVPTSTTSSPTTTASIEEQETTTNESDVIIKVIRNFSSVENVDVAKTVSERTGKAIGVPSDFTKQFNSSMEIKYDWSTFTPVIAKEDKAPAKLDAEPATGFKEDDHPGSNMQLTDDVSNIENISGDANDSLSDTHGDVKEVERTEPRFIYVKPVPTVKPEDRVIQKIFGGLCTQEVWNHCSRIKFWGGDYFVPDREDEEKKIVKHHKIRCQDRTETNLCLRNGWTVARCHMLCMSQCNLDFRLNYEKLVSHEGDCKMPLLLRKRRKRGALNLHRDEMSRRAKTLATHRTRNIIA